MKILKIIVLGSIFLMVYVFSLVAPSKVWSEENMLLAADVKTQQVTPVKPKQADCKVVEEKDKDGNIIYKLVGPGCEQAMKNVNAYKVKGSTCCVCKREGDIIVCRGSCCGAAMKSVMSFK